jgi:hypothetical protein
MAIKQNGSHLCQCRGSQKRGQAVVVEEEAVLEVVEVNDAEVKIADVKEATQEPRA